MGPSSPAAPTFRLLVDREEFWSGLRADIAGATKSVLVQAMTFEGDAAGEGLTEALVASRATDRRVLVDAYSSHVVSDKFIWSPAHWFDAELRDEVRRTRAMAPALEAAGARVRITNAAGFLFWRFPFRNHKKLMLIDGRVAYIGGFNFSDHNFAWHDMMIRIEDPAVAAFFARDFDATWEGRVAPSTEKAGDAHLFAFDGATNAVLFGEVLSRIAAARTRIVVHSPYLTFPFVDALREAQARGVAVTLITPLQNNKTVIRDYLLWEARRAGFDVQLLGGMSHLKAMLVDGDWLFVGSSNFDFLSYHCEEEVGAAITDRALVAEFDARVLAADLATCRANAHVVPDWRGRLAYGLLKAVELFARLAAKVRSAR